jgi:rhomboid family protein
VIFPVSHERTTVSRWPLASLALTVLCLLAFLLPLLAGTAPDAPTAGQRWGLTPAQPQAFDFVSYLFVHGGWMHLFFNLLFLYLTGPFVEDAWGNLPFLAFYLLAGAFTGGLYVLRYPGSTVPLIGASGAIAAVMGAFLVLFARTKVDFVYWFVVAGGVFSAPAWLMLPLWLGLELLSARAQDAMSGSPAGGVAYWVHVWGFLFGGSVALAVRLVRGSAAVPEVPADPGDLLRTASKARQRGQREQAWRLLEQAVRLDPSDELRRDALWDLARELGRQNRAAAIILADVRNALRQGPPREALERWHLLQRTLPELRADPTLLLRLSATAERSRRPAEARQLLAQAAASLTVETPVEAVLAVLRRTELGEPSLRREAARRVLHHPQLDPILRRNLEAEVG